MNTTPFSKWSEAGEADPHGEFYQGEITGICMGNLPSEEIARKLTSTVEQFSFSFIGTLTAGKERLRWLSRKVYNTTQDKGEMNKQRALMPLSELTDDELANRFFITEDAKDLLAGGERILWLSNLLDVRIEGEQ